MEGEDIVLLQTRTSPILLPGGSLPETGETYAAPLPRDKSFALQPGQDYVTAYTALVGQPAAPTTVTYSISSHYLGREVLTMQGKARPTTPAKFQFDDTRSTTPTVT